MAVVCRYLPPDGISREQAMNEIIELVDPLPEKSEREQIEPEDWRHYRHFHEQAEKQEPVAWDGNCVLGHCGCPDGCDRSGCCRANLAPRKEWVGLTELEVKHYNNRLSGSGVAQEIEAKLRERNT